ncbi:MAG: hypothetical protein HY435_01970 [Candidatus Liptonbacteria bacterium]|nr:hypothetical protein [Candidatus Liptonbacteria bacterium]
MSSLKYYYIFGLLIVFAALGALVFFLVSRSQPDFFGLDDARPAPVPAGPSADLWRSEDASSLFLRCNNIPEGTADIQIFRSKLTETRWLLWKTKRVFPGCDTEVVEIKIFESEDDPLAYKYLVKAVDADGNALWESGAIVPGETPPVLPGAGSGDTAAPPGSGAGAGQSGGGEGGAGVPPAGSSPAEGGTTPAGGGTAGGVPAGGGGGSGGTDGNYCYTPSGQVAGPCESATGQFWVLHADKRIEIGWQNLPSSTVAVVVYRSEGENGPWEKLDEKESINPGQAYAFRILDHTLHVPRYYRLDAKSGSGAVVESFGPLLLPALE